MTRRRPFLPLLGPAWLTGLCLAILTFVPGFARASHPQDGPHADLRIAIEDQTLRFSAGLNLAFIDHTIGIHREALEAVSPDEASFITAQLSAMLREQVLVTLNGQPVTARLESIDLWTDPDPSLAAFYPNTGMRALIRATAVLTYRSTEPYTEATITWPSYPTDMITTEVSPDGERPPMFLEAILRAEGGTRLVRFSQPNPTITWHTGDTDPSKGFTDLPAPPLAPPPSTVPGLLLLGGLVALVGIVIALLRVAPTVQVLATAAIVAGGIALASLALPGKLRVVLPWTVQHPAITEAEQFEVFASLHANLYKAFDYTAEGDVYDALTRSVSGMLLDEVYTEIYGSLRQAEQGGEQGVITGTEPLETAVIPRDNPIVQTLDPATLRTPLAFSVRHHWRVEGTVYHWGHSHSRTIEYNALYRVAPTDQGWRITDQRILDQRILGLPPAIPEGEI